MEEIYTIRVPYTDKYHNDFWNLQDRQIMILVERVLRKSAGEDAYVEVKLVGDWETKHLIYDLEICVQAGGMYLAIAVPVSYRSGMWLSNAWLDTLSRIIEKKFSARAH